MMGALLARAEASLPVGAGVVARRDTSSWPLNAVSASAVRLPNTSLLLIVRLLLDRGLTGRDARKGGVLDAEHAIQHVLNCRQSGSPATMLEAGEQRSVRAGRGFGERPAQDAPQTLPAVQCKGA